MAGLIKQSVKFSASATALYKMYMDEKVHALATGQKAKITAKEGGAFSAGNGYSKGKILVAKAGKMMVQTWRGKDWDKDDADSIVMITFCDAPEGAGVVELVQANVPDKELAGIKKGWDDYFWMPWKKYLADLKKPAPAKAAVKKPAVAKTAAKKPAVKKPATAKPAVKKSAPAKKPAAAKKPVAPKK